MLQRQRVTVYHNYLSRGRGTHGLWKVLVQWNWWLKHLSKLERAAVLTSQTGSWWDAITWKQLTWVSTPDLASTCLGRELLFSPNGTLSGEKHVALSAALKTGGAAAHLLSKGGRNKGPALFLLRGQFSSVQLSRSVMPASLRPHGLQHARPPCPSPTPGVYSNSCPLSQWCHPAISSSVVPFSSCVWSSPASGSFPMSQLFASGGQSIGVSTTTSVLPMNILKGHLPLTKCYLRTWPLHKQRWKTMKINPVILQVHDMFYSVTHSCIHFMNIY